MSEPLALAPQVLTEFVHGVTDPRRFAFPLSMEVALERVDIRKKTTLFTYSAPINSAKIPAPGSFLFSPTASATGSKYFALTAAVDGSAPSDWKKAN